MYMYIYIYIYVYMHYLFIKKKLETCQHIGLNMFIYTGLWTDTYVQICSYIQNCGLNAQKISSCHKAPY